MYMTCVFTFFLNRNRDSGQATRLCWHDRDCVRFLVIRVYLYIVELGEARASALSLHEHVHVHVVVHKPDQCCTCHTEQRCCFTPYTHVVKYSVRFQ